MKPVFSWSWLFQRTSLILFIYFNVRFFDFFSQVEKPVLRYMWQGLFAGGLREGKDSVILCTGISFQMFLCQNMKI